MSEQEKERLIEDVRQATKEGNKGIRSSVIFGSVGVMITVISGCLWLGGRFEVVNRNDKVTNEVVVPTLEKHTTQIAVINSKLKIQ